MTIFSASAKRIRAKVQSQRGNDQLLGAFIGILAMIFLIVMALNLYERVTVAKNVTTIAQEMAREISLEGALNSTVERRLDTLKNIFGFDDVDMEVNGDFITGGKKLRLQSEFVVTITVVRHENFMGRLEVKTYVTKASGVAEQYYKD